MYRQSCFLSQTTLLVQTHSDSCYENKKVHDTKFKLTQKQWFFQRFRGNLNTLLQWSLQNLDHPGLCWPGSSSSTGSPAKFHNRLSTRLLLLKKKLTIQPGQKCTGFKNSARYAVVSTGSLTRLTRLWRDHCVRYAIKFQWYALHDYVWEMSQPSIITIICNYYQLQGTVKKNRLSQKRSMN